MDSGLVFEKFGTSSSAEQIPGYRFVDTVCFPDAHESVRAYSALTGIPENQLIAVSAVRVCWHLESGSKFAVYRKAQE